MIIYLMLPVAVILALLLVLGGRMRSRRRWRAMINGYAERQMRS